MVLWHAIAGAEALLKGLGGVCQVVMKDVSNWMDAPQLSV